jgi:hypothetical protein
MLKLPMHKFKVQAKVGVVGVLSLIPVSLLCVGNNVRVIGKLDYSILATADYK